MECTAAIAQHRQPWQTGLRRLPTSRAPLSNIPPAPAAEDYACRLWVDAQGLVLGGCPDAHAVFGYRPDELLGRHVSLLLPDLADTELLHGDGVNPRLSFRSRCAIPFQAVARNGSARRCALFLYQVSLPAGRALAIIVRPAPSRPDDDADHPGR